MENNIELEKDRGNLVVPNRFECRPLLLNQDEKQLLKSNQTEKPFQDRQPHQIDQHYAECQENDAHKNTINFKASIPQVNIYISYGYTIL